MRHRSIRFRLTLWYSLALTAGLLVFAVAIWFSMKRSLMADLDQTLSARAQGFGAFLQRELAAEGTKHLQEELKEYSDAFPAGTAVLARDSQGNLLLALRPGFPFQALSAEDRRSTNLRWNGHNYRALLATVRQGDRCFEIGVGEPLDIVESMLARLRWLLVSFIPAVVIVATAGGIWLSRRALKPVDQITQAARSVGIGNLSERLSVPQTGDELQRLAETWNSMLTRLERAVKRLSRFTADASHELRTPLAVIRTTAEIASRRARSSDVYRTALSQIASESQRMTSLIEDLLFLARCDSESAEMPMESLDLSGVLEEACCHARSLAAGKNIAIESDWMSEWVEGHVSVIGNWSAIRRLLMVLLDNAIKYSPEGAAVKVTLRNGPGDVRVEIADRGVGIPESDIPFIFERFYRAGQNGAEQVSGYGIGLSLADAIAKRHGARIEVTSVLEEGSTFRLFFTPA